MKPSWSEALASGRRKRRATKSWWPITFGGTRRWIKESEEGEVAAMQAGGVDACLCLLVERRRAAPS
nr:unnamed protein product [Digitaria exilis]